MPVLSLAGVQQGDLVLPMARILHVPDPHTTIKDIDNLTYRLGGRSAKPIRPLAWRDRNGGTTLIAGLGIAEAAEIQDMAYALHDRKQREAKETQDQRRERVGLPSVHQTLQNISDALQDKADWFRRNPSQHQANYDPNEKGIY